jgi:2-polyprenyl-6-methoxyphenol hydroxylase-like FAD-dependent oxidoreductase
LLPGKFNDMTAAKSITIIGGGLAGLTLGIGLRQRGVLVRVVEAGQYPRHRVCGEFISGSGQETLTRLGLNHLVAALGAVSARTVSFHSAGSSTTARRLPLPAVCVSRFDLDAALADEFRRLGGELHCGQRWRNADGGEGIVYATGRVPSTNPDGEQWFGLKVHARNVLLTADLEMHVSPQGYVGLCKINGGEVNVCGLFRKLPGENVCGRDRLNLLRGKVGSPLKQRLSGAEFDEGSLCAVAGLSLKPKRAAQRPEICVGDTITMIPPVTGNGMSMAFESAELALAPLASWSRGELSWEDARRKISSACDTAFSSRLKAAQWLQRLVLTPSLQNMLVTLSVHSDYFWRMAFERTR